MFWQSATTEGNALPALLTFDNSDVALRVQLQPIGLDVLDDLIASGDLDPQELWRETPSGKASQSCKG